MAEKTSLLNKLPPVADKTPVKPAPAPSKAPVEPVAEVKPAAAVETAKPEPLAKSAPETSADTVAVAKSSAPEPTVEPNLAKAVVSEPKDVSAESVETVEAAEITISALDSVTYHSLLALCIFFALASVLIFSRRMRVDSSAPKKALFFGGIGLIAIAGYAFAAKSLFSDYLNQSIVDYPLWLKPIAWLIIAPLLTLTIPYLVTENPKAHKFFFKCAIKAAAAFLVLTISSFLDFGIAVAGVLFAVSLGLGISFALPLVKALRRLPGSLSSEAKAKIANLGFVVIGVILFQVITGGLSTLSVVAVTPIMFADIIVTFALMTVVLINIMGYISIQFPKEETAS